MHSLRPPQNCKFDLVANLFGENRAARAPFKSPIAGLERETKPWKIGRDGFADV